MRDTPPCWDRSSKSTAHSAEAAKRVTCPAPGSSSTKRWAPCSRAHAAAPVKELSTPTIRISRRSSVLRPASARYVPRSAIHVLLLCVRSGRHAGGQDRLHIDANHAGEGGSSPRARSRFPQVIQKILESRRTAQSNRVLPLRAAKAPGNSVLAWLSSSASALSVRSGA